MLQQKISRINLYRLSHKTFLTFSYNNYQSLNRRKWITDKEVKQMAYCLNEEMIEKKEPNRETSEERPLEVEEDDSDGLNINEEEINSLNMQLDQLNNALDKLEQKNDDLHAQLVELLEVNKQAREHFLQIRVQHFDSNNKTDT